MLITISRRSATNWQRPDFLPLLGKQFGNSAVPNPHARRSLACAKARLCAMRSRPETLPASPRLLTPLRAPSPPVLARADHRENAGACGHCRDLTLVPASGRTRGNDRGFAGERSGLSGKYVRPTYASAAE